MYYFYCVNWIAAMVLLNIQKLYYIMYIKYNGKMSLSLTKL